MKLVKCTFSVLAIAGMISIVPAAFAQGPSLPNGSQSVSSGSTAEQPSDSKLSKEVENALAHDPMTGASSIKVKTEDRMVTLSGTASSKKSRSARRNSPLTSTG